MDFESRLHMALKARDAAARALGEVDEEQIWSDDSGYVDPDIIRAAELIGVDPAILGGCCEVLRRVKAVRGTSRKVEELTRQHYDKTSR